MLQIRDQHPSLTLAVTLDDKGNLLDCDPHFREHFPDIVEHGSFADKFVLERDHSSVLVNATSMGLPVSSVSLMKSALCGNIWIQWFDKIQNGVVYRTGLDASGLRNVIKQFQDVSSFAKAGFWRLDLVNEKLYWSEEIYAIHGVTKENYTPELDTAIEFYYGGDEEIINRHVIDCIENQRPFQTFLRIQRPDKQIVHIESKGEAEFNTDGQAIAIYGTFRDRTHEHIANSNLEFQRIQLEDTLQMHDTLRTGLDRHALVSVTDVDGRMIYVNSKFCQISGYSEEELLGKDHRILNSGTHPQTFFADLWRTISSGEIWQGVICNRSKSGEKYWVSSTIIPFQDPVTNEIKQYLSVRTEITSEIMLQNRLRDALTKAEAANIAKSQFLANISHELRTPLNHILGFSQILEQTDLPDETREFVGYIGDGGRDLLSKIENILLYLQGSEEKSATQKSYDPVAYILDDLMPQQKVVAETSGRKIELLSSCASSEAFTVFPQENLKFVFQGLARNFCDFSERGSVMEIDVSIQDKYLAIQFQDNGPGFPEHVLKEHQHGFVIGDEGYVKVKSGLGIGLAIIRRFVKDEKGLFCISNAADGGAVVDIGIPLFSDVS